MPKEKKETGKPDEDEFSEALEDAVNDNLMDDEADLDQILNREEALSGSGDTWVAAVNKFFNPRTPEEVRNKTRIAYPPGQAGLRQLAAVAEAMTPPGMKGFNIADQLTKLANDLEVYNIDYKGLVREEFRDIMSAKGRVEIENTGKEDTLTSNILRHR